MYEMNKINRDTLKKVLLIFLTVVFVLLTAASCIFTLCRIPIYLTYEEAIADVQFEDGMLYVTKSDRVTGAWSLNDDIIFTSYRLRWWYNTQPEIKLDRNVYQQSISQDSWYIGSAAHGEDVLLYDLEDADYWANNYYVVSRVIEYICIAAFALGIVAAVIGFVLRGGRAGKVLICVGVFFLMLGLSCLFVTGGRLRYIYNRSPLMTGEFGLRYNLYFFGNMYIMIFLTTLFSWGACMSAAGLVRQLRKK